jgi:signal transduction histidine kinase
MLQTLTNLLSNAIKFSNPDSRVSLISERRGSGLLIRVRDQGRGIPTHKLQTIFERFQQVDASDSRDKGGTGLGLAICRSIVQQHGGAIWVDSTQGKGSEFFVLLPRFQPEDTSTLQTKSSNPVLPA